MHAIFGEQMSDPVAGVEQMTKLGVDNVPDFVRMLDSIDFKFR